MRSMQKDKRAIYISQPLPSEPILDDDGNETGEIASVYDEPDLFLLNLKPITSELERQSFGTDVKNIQKCQFTPFDVDGLDLVEGSIAWIGVEPNGVYDNKDLIHHPMNNNYYVQSVIATGGQTTAYFHKGVGAVKA